MFGVPDFPEHKNLRADGQAVPAVEGNRESVSNAEVACGLGFHSANQI
jgi:hypothetical protein